MPEENIDKPIKPNYWLCGAGDLNCPHWDDVDGCWMGCKEFGDDNCQSPEEDDDEEDDEESMEESRSFRKSEIDLTREYVEKVTLPSNHREGGEVGKGGSVAVNKRSLDQHKNDIGRYQR